DRYQRSRARSATVRDADLGGGSTGTKHLSVVPRGRGTDQPRPSSLVHTRQEAVRVVPRAAPRRRTPAPLVCGPARSTGGPGGGPPGAVLPTAVRRSQGLARGLPRR